MGGRAQLRLVINNRRLIRDFEQRTDVAETLIRVAVTTTMLRRIA